MNINDKLKLQRELGGLVLFKEGLFLRGYNESCYILTRLFHYDFKVNIINISKSSPPLLAVACGFPIGSLQKRLPQASTTAFGARLKDNFDLSNYPNWLTQQVDPVASIGAYGSMAREGDASVSTSCAAHHLPLTAQQLTYLQNWQKGNYPIEVDLGFIESLRQQLTKSADMIGGIDDVINLNIDPLDW